MSAPFPPPLAGRAATVMGLGLFGGGVAAARWLVEQGARVTVTDLRDEGTLAPSLGELSNLPIEFVLGEHRAQDFEQADLVVANPAVPPGNDWLARARAAGAVVTSEVELFLRTTSARLVLVTGTHGKSSTTHTLAQLLTSAGLPARAGGNIGAPLLGAATAPDSGPDSGPDSARREVCVVELSSYQLESLPRPCAPFAGVAAALVTCVRSDHLERHGSVQAYAAAKARIGELCGQDADLWLPGDLDDPRFTETRARVRRHGPGMELRLEGELLRLGEQILARRDDLRLPGDFQTENTLLALGVARGLGASAARLPAAVRDLVGLPHRLEDLGLVRGRRVFDNGVSTTPDSTVSALASLSGPRTLLLGGQRKRGLEFDRLIDLATGSDVQVIAFGAAAPDLAREFQAAGARARAVETVEQATAHGLELTPEGGTLLFSPACASFDAYPNFRARALAFRAALQP